MSHSRLAGVRGLTRRTLAENKAFKIQESSLALRAQTAARGWYLLPTGLASEVSNLKGTARAYSFKNWYRSPRRSSLCCKGPGCRFYPYPSILT